MRCVDNDFRGESRTGVILTWVRMGGPQGAVWEVLHADCIEYWDEKDLEVISETS